MEKNNIENPLYKYKKLIFIFFIILLLVFTTMTNSDEIKAGFEKMKLVPWGTTFMIIGLFILYLTTDTYVLKVSIDDDLLYFGNTFTVNMAGSFFSAITPLYIGSYPSRVYYLYKEGIEVDKILSGLTVKALAYQIVLNVLAVVAFFGTNVIADSGWEIAFYVGLFYNITLSLFLVLISSSKKFNGIVINFVGKLAKRFMFFKKREHELMDSINNYYCKTRRMYTDFKYSFHVFLSSLVKQMIYYIMPIFIFEGLGLPVREYIFEIIAIVSIIQIMVSVIPTPGGIGAKEFVFVTLFGIMYSSYATNGDIEAGMLIYQFVTHYLIIIIGLIATLYLQTRKTRRIRKKANVD